VNQKLDVIDHVAVSVTNIAESLDWYGSQFQCHVLYQDETWALIEFANIKLALVVAAQHPPHIGFFTPKASEFGDLKAHRDGTKSVYIKDPSGNSIELLATE